MALNFVRELAKKEILAPHLNRWFNAGEFPDEIIFGIKPNKEKDDAFHPSSDATLCARALYAKRMGHVAARDLSGDSYKTFFFGHYFHGMIQHVLAEELKFCSWLDVEKEKVIQRGWYKSGDPIMLHGNDDPSRTWWARGFIDIAHCEIPGHGDYLIDIKTMNSQSFRQQEMRPDLWKKYHSQVQLYMDWEGQDRAIILGAEKDSPHRFREWVIKRDPFVVEAIYERWDIASEAVRKGEPPECYCQLGLCPVEELYET